MSFVAIGALRVNSFAAIHNKCCLQVLKYNASQQMSKADDKFQTKNIGRITVNFSGVQRKKKSCSNPIYLYFFHTKYMYTFLTKTSRNGKLLHYLSYITIYIGKFNNKHWKQSKYLFVLQHKALAMVSGRVDFSSPVITETAYCLRKLVT